MSATHLAVGGPNPCRAAGCTVRGVDEVEGTRTLVDLNAGSLGSRREPQRVVEWVEAAAVAVVQRADVEIRRQHRTDLVAPQVAATSILLPVAHLFSLSPY